MIAGPIGNSLDGHGEERALSQSCLHLLAKKKLVVVWLAASPLYFNLFFGKLTDRAAAKKSQQPTSVLCVCVWMCGFVISFILPPCFNLFRVCFTLGRRSNLLPKVFFRVARFGH